MKKIKKKKLPKKKNAGKLRGKTRVKNIFFIVVLAFIFLLFLFLRLRYITSPIVDFHWHRQVNTASVARNFYQEGMNIFYPRTMDRGDTPGYVEMEFPIFSYLMAIIYKILGVNDLYGRYVAVLFACGTFIYLYLLSRRLLGGKGSLFAVGLFAFAPLAVYFTRTYQPESMYLFCATASIYHYILFLDEEKNRDFVLSTLFLAIAVSLKIAIAVALFFFYLTLGLAKKGLSMFKDWRIWAIALLGTVPVAFWYLHAKKLYDMTGLSWTLWLRKRDAFFRLDWINQPWYWNLVINQRFIQDLTITGFLLAAAGVVIAAIKREWRPIFWANIGFLIYFFLFMRANYAHHYYQLIGMIPASLACAATAEFAFEKLKLRENVEKIVLTVALMIFLIIGTYFYYGITQNWYLRMDPFIYAGQELASVSKPGDLVVTVNEFGIPEVLYFADRRGWNFMGMPSPDEVRDKAKKGAKYLCVLAVSKNPEEQKAKLDELAKNFPVIYNGMWAVIFDLRK